MPYAGAALEAAVSLGNLLQAGLERAPDAKALISLEESWSWSDLDRRAGRLASAYLALGLAPGDRVASLMPNRPALLAHYLACFKAGLVLTPLNYRYTPREIDHALEVSSARIILAHAERAADLAASRAAASLALGVIGFAAPTAEGLNFERLIEGEAVQDRLPPVPLDAPAAIFFTSGSTGPAKGVTHSVGSVGYMLASIARAYCLTPDDVMLPASSCSHVGAFSASLGALAVGASVAIARTFDHAELGPLMRATRPSVMTMLPASLLHLIREPEARAEDFSSLRLCRCGGDKVPAELEKEFNLLTGQEIHEGYGMTEIGIAANNPPNGLDKLGSVGPANPGFIFSIRDGEGTEVATGLEGRVFVSAPSTFVGYWNDNAATAEVLADGWLDTGDVMRADADGYFWFCGRRKQIIVHDGSNIAPQEVEDALLQHPAVESAGVVGISDLLHGENVRAYVELKRDAAPPTVQDLIAFARGLVGYKAPEDVVILERMPLNPTGKVDRAALKRLAAGDHAQSI